ncbi:MAG: radical SAM protein [Candidatus Thiodiazotropha sp. (ex Monitilora ramsayi)]|nr:radical SAM protein [Candidatus Thiodiazotropha sp. (ex Monitilora ramsayi)]
MDRKHFIRKSLKYTTLLKSHLKGSLFNSVNFVRIIPTDRCNLNCAYCWQKDDSSDEMSLVAFRNYLDKAIRLDVGLITILGGEPMLWDGIYEAIAACTEKNVLSDMTTNGTLLNRETITMLAESGLDYLNISTDGLKISSVSKKNNLIRRELIGALHDAKKMYGMHYRLNAVLYKDNFDEIKKLINFAKYNNTQISIGYAVPPVDRINPSNKDIYFSHQDKEKLQEIINYLLLKINTGYPIIDPDSYFENIFRFLNRERFWKCNYPTRYGWINIAPNGKIRSCTKKMDEMDINFLELDTNSIKKTRKQMKKNLKICNAKCYSNCAYDSSYYVHNKFQLAKIIISRLSG